MNYRHIYHAGNFADVVKHAVLALVIEHLKSKDAAFRVIDTHAGIGSYDLSDERAQRTGEWLGGIGRLVAAGAAPIPEDIAGLLAPYLSTVKALNPAGAVATYPGSPRVGRLLMRPQDRMVVNELHPQDAEELQRVFRRDAHVTVMAMDGWTALKAVLPPKERRGVVLIDPPFEATAEFGRMAKALGEAVRRFQTGVYILWYPIKDPAACLAFKRQLAENLPRLLEVELELDDPAKSDRLSGAGLIVHNPPYKLDEHLRRLIPWLADRMALDGKKPQARVEWLRE